MLASFDDRRQFSNVKAAFTSNEQNNAYVTDVKDYFCANIRNKADGPLRVKRLPLFYPLPSTFMQARHGGQNVASYLPMVFSGATQVSGA